MKHTKVIAIPEKEETVVDHVTCDLCRKEIEEEQYSFNETTIEMRVGSNYPEGGDWDITSFDMCTDCFIHKLMPWMEAQGAKPQVENAYTM